jgi:hypothetical protein
MKINNYTQKQQEQEFEQYIGYEEWLRDNLTPLSENDINNMDRVFCKSKILKSSSLNPINTLNYQPLQGA